MFSCTFLFFCHTRQEKKNKTNDVFNELFDARLYTASSFLSVRAQESIIIRNGTFASPPFPGRQRVVVIIVMADAQQTV